MDYTKLKETQKASKYNVQELAKEVGMPRERMGEILRGKSDPRVSDLEAVCAALGLEVVVYDPKHTTLINTHSHEDSRGITTSLWITPPDNAQAITAAELMKRLDSAGLIIVKKPTT